MFIKRMFSTAVILVFLAGYISSLAAELPDGAPYTNAVEVLSALKVINLDDEGLFYPDKEVTRAEFVNIIISMLGLEGIHSLPVEAIYSDVGGDYWAAGEIKTASEMKIIGGNGDGTFSPDDAITIEHAIKALISMMGYDAVAAARGGFPRGYLSLAYEKGLLTSVTSDYQQKLLCKDMAEILFKALSVNVVQSNPAGNRIDLYTTEEDTLLSYYMHMNEAERVKVNATSRTSLVGASRVRAGEVLIGNTVFKTGDTNVEDYLGYYVTIYYEENKEADTRKLLIAIPEKINYTLRVLSSDINGCSDNVFSYNVESGVKTKRVNISPTIDVVLNGVKFSDYTDATFLPETGDITFLDNNGDSIFDIAFINSYMDIAIAAIDYEYYKIYSYYTPGNMISIDRNKTESYRIIRQSDGAALDFDDLSVGDLISVKTSADNEYIEIVLCSENVMGKIDELSANKAVIDGREYIVAKSLLNSGKGAIKLGYVGVFHLNLMGEISHYDASDAGGLKYGYFITMRQLSAAEPYQLKLLGSDNTIKILKLASRIKLNGQSGESGESVVSAFKTDYATGNVLTEYLRQPFFYSVNNKDEIIMIDTAIVRYGEDNDTLNLGLAKSQQTYKTSIKSFGLKFMISDSTVIFRVPSVTDLTPEDKEFDVVSTSVFLQDSKYVAEPFNLSDGNLARVMVYYVSDADYTATWDSSFALVDKITEVFDDDGNQTSKLYCLVNGQYMSFMADNPAVLNPGRKLKRGDGIRITRDKNLNIVNVVIDFDSVRPYDNQTKGAILDSLYEFNGIVYGSDAGNLVVSTTTARFAGDVDFTDGVNVNIRPNGHIYIYDEAMDTISNGTIGDIMDYKNSGEAASHVFVRLAYERCRELVILKLKE